ncbi:uncharacterized protein LOC144617639 [Crassostrea virginica]
MWKCSVWSKALTCPATVLQRGEDEFVTGNCDRAKRIASTNVFRPALAIVEDVIMQVVPEEERFLAPKMELLKRSSNLHRVEPGTHQCREYVNEEGCRHLIFTTKYQLQLLSQTRGWYMFMDGTFKVVLDVLKLRRQLLSIHGFVRRDGREQQFILAFILISSRREEDYVKVLEGILSALPAPPALETFMIDFEQGKPSNAPFQTSPSRDVVFTGPKQSGGASRTSIHEERSNASIHQQMMVLPSPP